MRSGGDDLPTEALGFDKFAVPIGRDGTVEHGRLGA